MWPHPQEIADLVKFTEEILNGKLNFLCSVISEKDGYLTTFKTWSNIFYQKQSPRGALYKMCPYNFRKIQRKTTVAESLF